MAIELSSLESARQKYDNGYYAEKLEQGLVFQDFCTTELYKRGIVVVGYASRRYQNNEGENMLGAEIKRDGRFRETGNLYLETAEKSHPDRPCYIPSGIMRKDNAWLYVIGDEKTFWIFSKKYLQMMADNYEERRIATSIGRLMPVSDADEYCLRKIDATI